MHRKTQHKRKLTPTVHAPTIMKSVKVTIPRALKNEVWITYVGKAFDAKCNVSWCTTTITPFTFEAGHNVPESKGGSTTVANLRPICSQCNKSMGCTFTIDEFSSKFQDNPCKPNPTHAKKGGGWWRRVLGIPMSCSSVPSTVE